ncbi:MAG: 50S ribosomal protein L24 [Candidatus Latescibacterota bacterium]|nr:MAG: 50S ribosomal protein L24 [Candidatus Latescibacterota bacterium]
MSIIKNDTVKVISGNHKGKVGKVLKVFPGTNRIIVEKVHLVKRHQKKRSQQDQGGILEKEAPIHVSNVLLVCPKCSKPTRTGVGALADGKKVRVCKSCNEMLVAGD